MKKNNYNVNKFVEASQKERIMLRKLALRLGATMISAPHNCQYDAVYERNDTVSIVESKIRTFDSDKYNTVLIERGKYTSLMQNFWDKRCDKVLYICFYTDGFAYVFNLAKMNEPFWQDERHVKTTMGNNKKVDKVVGYLNPMFATKINLNI